MNRGQPSVFCYPDMKELLEGGYEMPNLRVWRLGFRGYLEAHG